MEQTSWPDDQLTDTLRLTNCCLNRPAHDGWMRFAHSFHPSFLWCGLSCRETVTAAAAALSFPCIDWCCVRAASSSRYLFPLSAGQTLFSIFIFLLPSAHQMKTKTLATYSRSSRSTAVFLIGVPLRNATCLSVHLLVPCCMPLTREWRTLKSSKLIGRWQVSVTK